MFKINNKSISFTFVMLAIFAMGLITLTPKEAQAEGGRNVTFGPTKITNSNPRVTSEQPTNGVVTGTSSNSANYGYAPFYNGNLNNPSTYTYKSTTVKNTSSNTSNTSNNTDTEDEGSLSNQSANAIYGSNSFMPSGLIQWILVAIIILALVILVRKALGKDREYHSTPLKHA